MRGQAPPGPIARLPLFLLLTGVAALSMYVPAGYALALDLHAPARSFFYAGTLGLVAVTVAGLAMGNRMPRYGTLGQLLSLLATFAVLPVFLAVPIHDALRTTSFLNAYFDMVSAITTTGADLFTDPARLSAPLHLWRAQVGWMGGLLMWIAASAILAPLSLGGFEVTARGEPGNLANLAGGQAGRMRSEPRQRLLRVTFTLTPIYAGLTVVLWTGLVAAGDRPLVALCHAMSVMATSGISPVGGVPQSASGFAGEFLMLFFFAFALTRLTFSKDTVTRGEGRIDRDPEFRVAMLLILGVPTLLFLRHWIGAFDLASTQDGVQVLWGFWGGLFTVASFLTTTGFVSGGWAEAQQWSGLGTPGLLLMGLALIGGGVATTAGGVKLLRVFSLYLAGLREMELLLHPSSVSGEGARNRRIQSNGAFIAWVFFMLFALTLTLVTLMLTALGVGFDNAILLSVASLSTTGPLIDVAAETPIRLIELSAPAKGVICAAMVLGRLETLAIIALLSTETWRN
ncbi:MAG: TrkH family potassium uptake protein [Rhodobacteraceae bacterium]|nr:TrkH family potassium uptake protein [Paracoccaceae bacterium]